MWRQPSPRLLLVRRLEVAAVTLLVAVAAGVVGWIAGGSLTGAIAAAVALVLGLVAELFTRKRVSAWRYAERDDDLLVSRGVQIGRAHV